MKAYITCIITPSYFCSWQTVSDKRVHTVGQDSQARISCIGQHLLLEVYSLPLSFDKAVSFCWGCLNLNKNCSTALTRTLTLDICEGLFLWRVITLDSWSRLFALIKRLWIMDLLLSFAGESFCKECSHLQAHWGDVHNPLVKIKSNYLFEQNFRALRNLTVD